MPLALGPKRGRALARKAEGRRRSFWSFPLVGEEFCSLQTISSRISDPKAGKKKGDLRLDSGHAACALNDSRSLAAPQLLRPDPRRSPGRRVRLAARGWDGVGPRVEVFFRADGRTLQLFQGVKQHERLFSFQSSAPHHLIPLSFSLAVSVSISLGALQGADALPACRMAANQ